MAYLAALTRVSDVVTLAAADARTRRAGPDGLPTFNGLADRQSLTAKFVGAIVRMTDNSVQVIETITSPAARGPIKIGLKILHPDVKKRTTISSVQLDSTAHKVTLNIIGATDLYVHPARRATVRPTATAHKEDPLTHLDVYIGDLPPHSLPIADALKELLRRNSAGRLVPVEEMDWVPQPAEAAATADTLEVPAALLGATDAAPRTLLHVFDIMEIPPSDAVGQDPAYAALAVAQVVSALGGVASLAPDAAAALADSASNAQHAAAFADALQAIYDAAGDAPERALLVNAIHNAKATCADGGLGGFSKWLTLGDALRQWLKEAASVPGPQPVHEPPPPPSGQPPVPPLTDTNHTPQLDSPRQRQPPGPAPTTPADSQPPAHTRAAAPAPGTRTLAEAATLALLHGTAAASAQPTTLAIVIPLDPRLARTLATYFPEDAATLSLEEAFSRAGGAGLISGIAGAALRSTRIDALLQPADLAHTCLRDLACLDSQAEADLSWTPPARPADYASVPHVISQLISAAERAGRAQPLALPAPPRRLPPGLPPSHYPPPPAHDPADPWAQIDGRGRPAYGLYHRPPAAAALDSAAVHPPVLGPLVTREGHDLIQRAVDSGLGPSRDPIADGAFICNIPGLGSAAAAYFISSGAAAGSTSGEQVNMFIHQTRLGILARSRLLVDEQVGDGDDTVAARAQLAKAVATLTGLTCELVITALGGHRPEHARGQRAPAPGSLAAGSPGTLVGEGARYCIPIALARLAAIIDASIGRVIGLAGGEQGYGLARLATAFLSQAGLDACKAGFDDFFRQLGHDATRLRSVAGAGLIDITGLARSFTEGTLVEATHEYNVGQAVKRHLPAASASAHPASTPTPAAAHALAQKQAAGLAVKLENARRKQLTPPLAAMTPAEKSAYYANHGVPPLAPKRQKVGHGAPTPVAQLAPTPPPPPAHAAPVSSANTHANALAVTNTLTAAAAPGPRLVLPANLIAATIATYAQASPIDSFGRVCKALDAVVIAAGATQPSSFQWPCAPLYLFGVCPSTKGGNSRTCNRCADSRGKGIPPPGSRSAIKAACSANISLQNSILSGD